MSEGIFLFIIIFGFIAFVIGINWWAVYDFNKDASKIDYPNFEFIEAPNDQPAGRVIWVPNDYDIRQGITWIDRVMVVCDKCGNKRCPHASDSNLKCTNSNKPGQDGSIYTEKGIVN